MSIASIAKGASRSGASPLPSDLRLLHLIPAEEVLKVPLVPDQHQLLELSGGQVLKARHLLPGADAGADDGDLPRLVILDGGLLFTFSKQHDCPSKQLCLYHTTSRPSSREGTFGGTGRLGGRQRKEERVDSTTSKAPARTTPRTGDMRIKQSAPLVRPPFSLFHHARRILSSRKRENE